MSKILSKLIQRSTPSNISYGTVLSIDKCNKRLLARCKGDVDQYIAYSPIEFPSITVGDVIMIGVANAQKFLLSRIPSGLPKTTVILDV
jgi:hypothetical protein